MSSLTSPPREKKSLRPVVRAVARDVLQAFGYVIDAWTHATRAGYDMLVFPVPSTETITLSHFVAARQSCRRARVTVNWTKDHLRFAVRVPAAATVATAKRAASAKVDRNLHKKQCQEGGGGPSH